MSAANRAVVAGGYDAFNTSGIPGILDLLHEDVRWFALDFSLRPVHVEGRSAAGAYIASMLEQASDVRFEPLTLDSQDDRVLARVRLHARAPGAAAPGAWEMSHLWHLRDGRMTRFRLYVDAGRAQRRLTRRRADGDLGAVSLSAGAHA